MEPAPAPVVSAIVVCYRQRDLLLECVEALAVALDRLDAASELLVVDNSPRADLGSLAQSRVPRIRVLPMEGNAGFAGAVARGVGAAGGQWLALINDDACVDPETLVRMVAAGEASPDIGSVAATIRWSDRPGELNSAGLEVDALGIASERLAGAPLGAAGEDVHEVWGATACVALYRRAMLDAVGGFDASFFAYQEDVDVAWRARAAGWRCVLEPRAGARHAGSASSGEGSAAKYRLVGRNRIRLLAKNATTGHLVRWGWAMLAYDIGYVIFVALTDRTAAPLAGRVEGLGDWIGVRRAGAPSRRPTRMAAGFGPLAAWRQRAAYRR